MPVEIRMLEKAEASVLDAVADDVFDDAIDRAAAREFLSDPRHHLAVAIDDGVVVGFVSAVRYVHPDKRHPELWINEVGVAPSHQGRGLGKRLLQTMLDSARGSGCHEAWVLTERTNEPAMRLYSATGGQEAPGELVMFNFLLDRQP